MIWLVMIRWKCSDWGKQHFQVQSHQLELIHRVVSFTGQQFDRYGMEKVLSFKQPSTHCWGVHVWSSGSIKGQSVVLSWILLQFWYIIHVSVCYVISSRCLTLPPVPCVAPSNCSVSSTLPGRSPSVWTPTAAWALLCGACAGKPVALNKWWW